MSKTRHIVCGHCGRTNRLPVERASKEARCGACHQPLFTGHPVEVDEEGFGRHVAGNDIPVLVDVWAPWCGPCRAENPNVVTAYNEFRGKNFTILGVSLDKEKDAWQQAIRADHLDWTHVSDLKFWQSQAVNTFGFNGIPFNVLIDPQGKVIAQALRGDDLENELKSVLK